MLPCCAVGKPPVGKVRSVSVDVRIKDERVWIFHLPAGIDAQCVEPDDVRNDLRPAGVEMSHDEVARNEARGPRRSYVSADERPRIRLALKTLASKTSPAER